MTMLTEAICSRRPVYSLRPQRALPNRRYQQAIQRFSDQGLLCRYALAALAEQPALLEGRRCEVLKESPLAELSEQLGKRLALL